MVDNMTTYISPVQTIPAIDKFNPHIDNAFDLMDERIPEPEWEMEGWWVNGGMGIIGGTPKTRKSTLSMEMAVSFATGSKFLGLYPVLQDPAPILMVQEENTRSRVRHELEAIFAGRDLLSWAPIDKHQPELGDEAVWSESSRFKRLDIMSANGFSLTNSTHLQWLADHIIKHEYKYVFMDPLYMIGGGIDINKAAEVVPVLRTLTKIKDEFGCAPILVHHMSGKSTDDPRAMGARLMGTTFLHGWYECGVFPTRATKDNPNTLEVFTEFRDKPAPEPFVLDAQAPGKWKDIGALAAAVVGKASSSPSVTQARLDAALRQLKADPLIGAPELMAIGGFATLADAAKFINDNG